MRNVSWAASSDSCSKSGGSICVTCSAFLGKSLLSVRKKSISKKIISAHIPRIKLKISNGFKIVLHIKWPNICTNSCVIRPFF